MTEEKPVCKNKNWMHLLSPTWAINSTPRIEFAILIMVDKWWFVIILIIFWPHLASLLDQNLDNQNQNLMNRLFWILLSSFLFPRRFHFWAHHEQISTFLTVNTWSVYHLDHILDVCISLLEKSGHCYPAPGLNMGAYSCRYALPVFSHFYTFSF